MRSLAIVLFLSVILSGCTDKFVKREQFEIFEASMTRRINRINYDLNIAKGAANENRNAIDLLQQQVQEINSHLGILKENIKKVDSLKSNFNSKLNNMMEEVVKENERLINEINKTREYAGNNMTEDKSDNINVYNKSGSSDLSTGYYHYVESGESLSKIAIKYQVPIDDIIHANELTNPNRLKKGQKLFIPDPGE